MSDPDDKSRADGSDSRPKSVFDSDWDTLLGDAASTSDGSRPIFAPPTSGLGSIAGIVKSADPTPRTSDARASVSGEFLTPTPRPQPITPPRYEPPPGVDADDSHELDTAEHPVIDPMLDRGAREPEPEPELAKVIELGRTWSKPIESSAAKPDRSESSPDESDEFERSDLRETQPIRISAHNDADAEVEAKPVGGSRGLTIVVVAVGLGLTVMAAKMLGGDDQAGDEIVQKSKPEPRDPIPDPSLDMAAGTSAEPVETETSGSATDTSDTGDGSDTETETGEVESTDPRDPKLIPPGTPKENADAFLKLPVSIHDGPPIGGIGRTGLHIDTIATASGGDNTECDDPSQQFSVATAEFVNVCFRIVHPRGAVESLRIYWEKDGKVTRRSRVRVPELRAYATRGYLLLRPEYVGKWRVRITPDGDEGIVLAVAEFEITE